MADIKEFSEAFPFYQKLTDAEKRLLNETVYYTSLESGEMMIEAGQRCAGIGFVISGTVRLYRLNEDGHEITLYYIRRGEVCVLSAACFLGKGSIDYPIGAIAEADSKIALLSFDTFGQLFEQSKTMREFLFTSLADRLFNLMEVVNGVAFKSINERLCEYIIKGTKNGKHPLYATHAEIARDIGTAREVVSRSLKSFERNNYIKLTRGRVDIIDMDGLVKYIGSTIPSRE